MHVLTATRHARAGVWARRLAAGLLAYLTVLSSGAAIDDALPGRLGLAGGFTFTAPPYADWSLAWAVAGPTSFDPVRCALGAVMVVPLFWRRRAPVTVLAVVLCGYAVANVLGAPPVPANFGVLVALHGAAQHLPPSRRRPVAVTLVAVAVAWVALLLAIGRITVPGEAPVPPGKLAPGEVLLPFAALAAAWWIGLGAARRHEAARLLAARAHERERTAVAEERRATAEQRLRLARDLHDGLGHDLTAIAMLAAAHREHTDPAASAALARIEQAARSGLAEIRTALSSLRDRSPAPDTLAVPAQEIPGLTAVPSLVARARAVTTAPIVLDLAPHLAAGAPVARVVQACAYRVVQEGLTNALRHAPGAAVHVRVGVAPAPEGGGEVLEVIVTDDGHPGRRQGPVRAGPGHGLVGMHERVDALGGHLEAGPRKQGWHVHAVLPLTPAPARPPVPRTT